VTNKKILLLGGSGYIGSRLYPFLKDAGLDVTNIDINWFGNPFEDTLIYDYGEIPTDFFNGYSHIIVLAAHSSVSMCDNVHEVQNNNVVKFTRLLENVDKSTTIIYASSLAVFGSNPKVVTETDQLTAPINAYDYSKICRENVVKLYDLNTVGLRFGTVGGYSMNYRGENLMNAISLNAITKGSITLSNTELKRALLGITDLCRAMLSIINSDVSGHKIYNLSSENKSILEFGQEIQRLTNCELTITDSLKTGYSFQSSSTLFEKDFNFKFTDTVETVFNDINDNYKNIIFNTKRTTPEYV
jgi:nucleoside-diphosphate-sugar epimerase